MLFFILLIDTLTVGALTNKPDCMFLVRNDYESPVEVNWIDPSTGGRVLMSNPYIRRGSDFTVHSYVSHTFEFKELPDTQTGKCAGDSTECRVASYTVNQPEKQWLTLDSNFEFQNSDHFMNARNQQSNFKDDCKNQASEAMQSGVAFDQVFERMVDCMEHETMMHLLDASKDVYFEEQLRKRMGSTYENYTCMDFDLPTSDPVDQRTWIDPKSGQKLISLVMLERPASKIHLIENFITEEECVAMEETARPMLRKAVVADGSGGHQESPNRKALQAGIVVPWDKEGQQHPITSISRRVYDYVNYAMGIEIDEHGQENLMSIQYKAENRTGELKYEDYDQYLPHCDGDCTGNLHKHGSRVATMVMYCTVPTRGGATNFRNSGIHVQAKKGNAIFFSYYDVQKGVMDTGFTEHSGCPVVEGEKKIVTQWVRHGVTKEVPWTAYNSLGILISKTNELDNAFVLPDLSLKQATGDEL